ncbi:hypothetical protein QBC46DRAFT_441511 [Diplogelasinospora grovesii]|uniref:Peptidase S8/S53 domain-containing protein n=1 Tax=Diplogelasinospora grovesii TaxID=303347 RepID=A0AAN6N330_9PEZI|nr:hypothetical protein QBC46DRAFT_441511 [Diplogelasinospora grovesii]
MIDVRDCSSISVLCRRCPTVSYPGSDYPYCGLTNWSYTGSNAQYRIQGHSIIACTKGESLFHLNSPTEVCFFRQDKRYTVQDIVLSVPPKLRPAPKFTPFRMAALTMNGALAMNGDGMNRDPNESTPRQWLATLRKGEMIWRESQKDKRFAKRLDHHANQLLGEITDALEDAIENKPNAKNDAIIEITRLLRDADDSCIRWLILFDLVQPDLVQPGAEEEVEVLVVEILVRMEPFLAFENPYQSSENGIAPAGGNIWKSECKDTRNHWQGKKKSTPFHTAAANGNAKAVDHMIRCLDEYYCKTQRLGEAPDSLDKGEVEVVNMFLEHDSLRKTFVTSENIIHAMDKISQLRTPNEVSDDRPETIIYSLIQHAVTSDVFNSAVVKKIIELNLQDVWSKWRKLHPNVQLDTSCLLHLAVLHQNLEFVKIFAVDYPESVTAKAAIPGTDGHRYHPLWYNNRNWDSSKSKWVDWSGSPEIRTEIVTATIRRTEKMQVLSEILQQSAEKVRELCFDISLFNSKSYRLYDFVQSLISHRENETLLSYEPTIKYARFPAMDLHPDDKETFGDIIRHDHREVFDVLDWLKESKAVTSVIELKVPDRLVNPHNELQIAKYVSDFGVEVLDWRFLDLSLSVFDKDKVKPRIRGLHLYASGKRAVISHWFSSQGLESFPNETMTKAYCEKTCKYIRTELRKLKRFLGLWKRNLVYGVNSQPWNPTHESLADLEELAQRAFPKLSQFILSYRTMVLGSPHPSKGFNPTKIAIIDNGIMSMSPASYDGPRDQERPKTTRRMMRSGSTTAAALGGLTKQEKGKRRGQDNNTRDAKTGAVETGDDDDDDDWEDLGNPNRRDGSKGYRTLWSRIEQGRSFVDDDFQVSPWLFASDPHGTQMANLICAIDPACRLYVAKVTDGRYGITPHRVARPTRRADPIASPRQAIQWARDEKVDIISMSFAILETSVLLDTTIADANADGIVLLCSTHDEGSNVGKAWPADSAETFTVTACDEYGALPRITNEYKYKLQGLNVAAGVIPFLESPDRISGSSVATAIAAGPSSLIVSCLRLANPDRPGLFTSTRRRTEVEKYLDAMQSAEGSKYVLLEKFGRIDAKIKDGEPIKAEVILEDVFKKNGEIRLDKP